MIFFSYKHTADQKLPQISKYRIGDQKNNGKHKGVHGDILIRLHMEDLLQKRHDI